ncbi:flippase-like domain-containing protein [Ensifer adhaerens]|uniref:lysylphosphatidylglycerol synthase domain-containing protein n=1 Tax=Ensifer adhaerens TaxID=106592 RepID=UPI001CBBDB3F|nr:lysylphosphatidylglycerol synthase domain-containing protein [Ensifer adhaerens]MBZ7920932.1 flippase-like domain-containing protein [Ensifer adhaerens]UAX93379.1 flippase-like domain-containing protein [Ensifer adhaerens]UAY01016.1 flippase-like domain-containing protein [Ensifer adhaerens]UAY08397.1 flippase-like domain-containing protein [Ensifer adhaerens]
MISDCESDRRSWLARNRMTLLSAAAIAAYAAFVEWFWGWPALLKQWSEIGFGSAVSALVLLVATYFIRCYRIYDYFPKETAGRFLPLFRVTQVHNLLNIMLPFRAGETSFPLLMRSEFSVPLARGTSALLVMRLLDLHALLVVAAVGLVIGRGSAVLWAAWLAAFVSPLLLFLLKNQVIALARRLLPTKLDAIVDELEAGVPANIVAFLRAWGMTILNWAVKVIVLAWVLAFMGVAPLAACFGGALGGELSSVLPMHAPAGVGTYPAAIAAGAVSFGAHADRAGLEQLAAAGVNAHLLIIVSAVAGTMLSMALGRRR